MASSHSSPMNYAQERQLVLIETMNKRLGFMQLHCYFNFFLCTTHFHFLQRLLCNTTFAEAITCTLCNKLYIGETGRHLGDLFHEHLRDVEKNDKDASNPVVRHFNLPNHSKQHMAICGLSLQQGTAESRNNLEHKLIFHIRTLNPHGINKGFSLN